MSRADGIARLFALGGVVTAAWLAYRSGGGADAAPPPPEAAQATPPLASAESTKPAAATAPAYEVVMRLNEMLGDATRIDTPALTAAYAQLAASHYYRYLPGPWTRPSGPAARLPMAATMVTTMEIAPTITLGSGRQWTPDGKTWNMNEGSFDMREAIFAPSPSTIEFHVTIPLDARLEYAPGVLQHFDAATVFAVTATDEAGEEHALSRFRVGPGDAKKWFSVAVDLASLAGKRVALRLETSTDGPQGDEKRWTRPPPPAPPRWSPPPPKMALALWGNPRILSRAATKVPYNVLFIVVDALRPDVSAAFHDDADDAKARAAKYPPLDALLPRVPGMLPTIDALAARGVRFTHAYSAGSWTRPGTLAMLAGARSSELGVDTKSWLVPPEEAAHFYASDPALISLLLRRQGVTTFGVIDNFYMTGYAEVALDFGFEGLVDHRYRVDDTAAIEKSAEGWLRENRDRRFFLFCNFNSPHEPFEPPQALVARIPPSPNGPEDTVRRYMAEGAKDDAAIGKLLDVLDALDLRKNTVVVVTSDHGETLSSAHNGQTYLDEGGGPLRFHHQNGIFEETTRIPILLSLPGVLDGDKAVTQRVRNIDLAPTILELEGLAPSAKMSGASLMPLVRGDEKADRVVVSEGRGMRALLDGKYRYVQREGAAVFVSPWGKIPDELFDLENDPGERHSIHLERPDVVRTMKERLASIVRGTTPSLAAPVGAGERPTLRLRFAGAGEVHAVAGTIVVGDQANVALEGVGVPSVAFRRHGEVISFSFATSPTTAVGVDLRIDPPNAPVSWTLTLDGKEWPDAHVYAGPFGLPATYAARGVATDDARDEVYAPDVGAMDLEHDLGLFVTRDRRGGVRAPPVSTEGAAEMRELLEQWGYAHAHEKKPGGASP